MSIIHDVVDRTILQLNPVLAEGGGEHAKNRFGDNKQKIIPNLTLCKMSYLSIHGQMPFRRWIDQETRRGENM